MSLEFLQSSSSDNAASETLQKNLLEITCLAWGNTKFLISRDLV